MTFSVKSRDDRESNTDWDRPPSEFWEVTRPNQRPEGSETLDPFALLGIMGPQHRSRVVVCLCVCVCSYHSDRDRCVCFPIASHTTGLTH